MSAPHLEEALATLARIPRGRGRVVCTESEGVVEVLIDNPTRAGAVGPGMMLDFAALAKRLCPETGPVVLLHSSSQRAFCAGGDLSSVRQYLLEPEMAGVMLDVMTDALNRIARAAAFVVAAVEGPALGGGAELLTACDAIVLGDRARIGFVHAGLGVSPGWGGGRRLVERVGRRNALKWLLDPQPRLPDACCTLGLGDVVVDAGQALAHARTLAQRVARVPAPARIAAATLVRDPEACERDLFLGLWGGPDHRAALARVGAGN